MPSRTILSSVKGHLLLKAQSTGRRELDVRAQTARYLQLPLGYLHGLDERHALVDERLLQRVVYLGVDLPRDEAGDRESACLRLLDSQFQPAVLHLRARLYLD